MKKILFTAFIFSGIFAHALDEVRVYNAIESDQVSVIQKMVASGELSVDEKISAQPYGPGTPIILIAGRAAALKCLAFLIQNKADVDARNSYAESALMLASFFNDEDGQMQPGYTQHEKAVHMLVDAGAELESPPEKYNALEYAAYQAHDRILSYLLSKGAKPDGYVGADGVAMPNTPLMMNAVNGNLEGAKILLRAGANPSLINARNKSALVLAKEYAQLDQAKVILCAQQLQPGENFTQKCE